MPEKDPEKQEIKQEQMLEEKHDKARYTRRKRRIKSGGKRHNPLTLPPLHP